MAFETARKSTDHFHQRTSSSLKKPLLINVRADCRVQSAPGEHVYLPHALADDAEVGVVGDVRNRWATVNQRMVKAFVLDNRSLAERFSDRIDRHAKPPFTLR